MTTWRKVACCLATVAGLSFAASADGIVPRGYTRLKYIQGAGEQWIHSNYTPAKTDRFEMKVNFADVSTMQALYCSRKGNATTQTTTGFLLSTGKLRFDRRSNAGAQSSCDMETDRDYVIGANYDNNSRDCTVDGESVAAMSSGDYNIAGPITFFASHVASNGSPGSSTTMSDYGTYKLYYFRAYDSAGRLIHEFLPVSDDSKADDDPAKYGLYDTVALSYRANVATNEAFVAYPAVKGNLVIEPVARQVYRGSALTPAVTVTSNGVELDPTKDYTVDYFDNAAPGTGFAVVTGSGDYAGQVASATFAISGTFADDYLEIDDDSVAVREVGNRRVYVFTDATGEIAVRAKQTMTLEEAMLVGGGGAGGWGYNSSRVSTAAGGGGGGVVFTNVIQALETDDLLSVTVGKGGDPLANYDTVKNPRPTGGNGGSSFLVIGETKVEAYGGGGGTGSGESLPGKGKLGSSGGFRSPSLMNTFDEADGVYYDSTQGWYGGYSTSSALAGGGGGAGCHRTVVGASVGNANNASDGGEGRPSFITGECEVYGSGGGSGGWEDYSSRINGGRGGTHAGTGARLVVGTNGTIFNADNGFGGGGGGGSSISDAPGGKGGSGTVILSFAIGDTTDGHLSVEVPANYPYDAEGLAEPDPVVKVGETLLVRGEDYDVSYAGNLTNKWESGFAEVTVTGKGPYAGKSVTKSFRAVRAFLVDLSVTEAADGRTWATATTFADAYSRCGNDWEIWLKAGTYARSGGLTVEKEIAVRGGFAGDDDDPTRLADEPYTVFDGQNTVGTLLTLQGGTIGFPMIVERCWFRRGAGNMVLRNRAGSNAIFIDCKFTDTDANKNRGARGFAYTGYTNNNKSFMSFRDCLFANLLTTADNTLEGYAININSVGCLHLWNCQFVSNGVPLSATSWFGGSGVHGASIRVAGNSSNQSGMWAYVRAYGCKFIGGRENQNDNGTWNNSAAGSAVYLSGDLRNCEFANCLFLGNEDTSAMGTPKTNPGGAFYFGPRNGLDSTVTVSRCTFAYNLASGLDGAAGFHLAGGVANIRDSIFYGNVVGSKVTVGSDMHVASSAYANVSNTLFATEAEANLGAYVSAADSTHLSLEDIRYGDPKFVTGRATWLAHLTSSAGEAAIPVSPHYVMIDPETSDDVYGFDVHLKSSGGYFTNDGAWHENCDETSDAILSDGSNLGCYAGTAEESKLLQITPELESVEVDWKDGYSQPVITFLPGGSVAYNAKATITYGVEGDMRTAVIPSVPSGAPYSFIAPTCFAPGASFTASVRLEVGSESAEAGLDEPVTIDKDYPPSWGKGGGAGVIHVSATATGDGSGRDWFNARTDFYQTLDLLDAEKDELWLSGDIVPQATPATFKPKAAVTIRGGFAGSETDPVKRQPGVLSTIDGSSAYTPLTLENDSLVKIERVRFTHSRDSGLIKSGAGNIALLDCAFTANATNMVSVNGRGARLSGTAGITQAVVSNCMFAGNQYLSTVQNNSACYGFGLYLANLAKAEVIDTSFVTNGVDRASFWPSYNDWNARETMSGTAIYAASAPLVARRCRFVANLACTVNGNMSSSPGSGTVVLTGAGGGSVFENCLWLANAEENYTTGATGQRDRDFLGCLRVDLSNWADTVSLTNCTMAYNIAETAYGPAGLYVQKGDVRLVNSIVWGNAVCNQCRRGADIYVASNSSLRASYSLLATNSANYVTIAAPTSDYGTVTWGPGMVYGDPLFVTDAATFLSNVHGGTPAIPRGGSGITFGKSNEVAKELCAFNVHVKGRHGYKDETTGEVVKYPKMRSPAIDAGDPNVPFPHEARPRGQRINLGFYGNTPWATMSGGGTLIFVR